MISESERSIDREQFLLWAQTLVETIPQLVWTCTPDGSCDYLSRQWVEFTGIPESEQLGYRWIHALHPDDRDRVARAWYDAVNGRAAYDLEYRIRRHDGLYRWFKTRGVPQIAPDGTILRWLGTCTDIEDQKLIEEQISGLLASISDALFIIDRDWRYVFVNPPAAAFANLSPAEMIGRGVWELFPEEKGSVFEESAIRAFETGKEVRYEIRREDSGLSFEMDIFPYQRNIIVFARDITSRRRLEHQLQQTAKLESLGVLAGGIAHDFNNLLVGIMGNVSLVLDMLPEDTPVRPMLLDAVTASERAALLTRQLLAYAGKGQFHLEPVDIAGLVRQTKQLIRGNIPGRVQLKLDLAENLPRIQGDSSQIQQIIMNLVINGAEAIDENTVGEVRVKTSLRQIDDSPDLRPGQYVMLEVEDTGSGMTRETLARIFDPFYTTKFTGRGLGLAAVQGIVRSHKGSLEVESTFAQGSTFRILLPVSTL